MEALQVVVGFLLLLGGAELLVKGASRLGAMIGLSPLAIGLTVVAFGTSAPELAVSLLSALRGEGGIAVGNVVGSNSFNVLVVLGSASLLRPIAIEHRVVAREVPIMFGVSLLAYAFAWNGSIGPWEAALLCLGLALFLLSMRGVEGAQGDEDAAVVTRGRSLPGLRSQALVALVGLALLVYGAQMLVDGATGLARSMGVSELVIGLTLVAGGTSLPELATSVIAALRGERDIAVGNVVGSNVFNLLGVLGIAGLVARTPVVVPPAAIRFDFPVMIATAGLCFVFLLTGRRLSRVEGGVLLGCYVVYVMWLFRAAGG